MNGQLEEALEANSAIRPASPRVLMVATRYFPYMGGVETHVYEVARQLVRDGVNVTVLTTDTSAKLPAHEQVDGVKIVRVRAWPANRDYYLAPQIYKIIRQGNWDVVHCQGYHTLVPPLAMLAAKRAKIPYLVSFHSGGHSSRWRNAIRGLQRSALRPLLAGAERLVAVSQFEAEFFQQKLGLPAKQFVVIPNGARLPQVDEPVSKPADTLIVSVGRLERYKGHHRIIGAFSEILKKRPDARLKVVGAGPYEAELKQLVQSSGLTERVEIGAIPPGDRQGMAKLLLQASLMVLLSEYEAHPVAVMEAVGLGCPVLVADTSGLRELAERGLAKAISLDSSPAQIATAVVNQLEQPLNPSSIELPTWEGCAVSLLNLYTTITRQRQVLTEAERGNQHV